MNENAEPIPEPGLTHTEEMTAAFNLSAGRCVSLKGKARTTPAGLVAAARLVCAITVPAIWWGRRRG